MASPAALPPVKLSPTSRVAWTCPECARPLIASGGCALCPACGFSPCG